MISAGHSAHTIADNSQGICLKHRDNGAGNPLSRYGGCGVDYGKGRNTPLRISPVPFHDVENGCFTNLEVSGDTAVTSAFFGGLNDFGSDLI